MHTCAHTWRYRANAAIERNVEVTIYAELHPIARVCIRMRALIPFLYFSPNLCFEVGTNSISSVLTLTFFLLFFRSLVFFVYSLSPTLLYQNAVAYADRPLLIPNRDKKKTPRTGISFPRHVFILRFSVFIAESFSSDRNILAAYL